MKKLCVLFLFAISFYGNGQTVQKEVLLIGTFHFNNPGLDVVKVESFDVMTRESQAELEVITEKISNFNPQKVFVEWSYDQEPKLDTLYDLYLRDQYFDYADSLHPGVRFYTHNEIFQLAFPAARKSNNDKVFAIDYPYTKFPFDSLMTSLEKANQFHLIETLVGKLKEIEAQTNEDQRNLTLTQLILKHNTEEQREMDLAAYITLLNMAGTPDNFVGAYLVSEWYRRNLYMYSLLQKITSSEDERIMVLLGSSHVSLFKKFIDLDLNYKVVELRDIL